MWTWPSFVSNLKPLYEGGGRVIGIDLGTSNSSVGVWKKGSNYVKIIKNFEHSKLTPSVVSFKNGASVGKEEIILGNTSYSMLLICNHMTYM